VEIGGWCGFFDAGNRLLASVRKVNELFAAVVIDHPTGSSFLTAESAKAWVEGYKPTKNTALRKSGGKTGR
jgi:hypothetical protein